MILSADFHGFVQGGFHRTVFVFRQLDGVGYGLFGQPTPAQGVHDVYVAKGPGRIGVLFAGYLNFQTGQALSLFVQNIHDIDAAAATQGYQQHVAGLHAYAVLFVLA
jgi:hypothetical protein